MDKIQKAVYDRVKQHCEYAKSTRCVPVLIMHSLLLEIMRKPEHGGYDGAEVNAALRVLYSDRKIAAGKTAHGCYITLPEYAGK